MAVATVNGGVKLTATIVAGDGAEATTLHALVGKTFKSCRLLLIHSRSLVGVTGRKPLNQIYIFGFAAFGVARFLLSQ
jgi:hypothetical protein